MCSASPGLFRGALDVQANGNQRRDEGGSCGSDRICGRALGLSEEYIVPSVFNRSMAKEVARAVSKAAEKTGVARRKRHARGHPSHAG